MCHTSQYGWGHHAHHGPAMASHHHWGHHVHHGPGMASHHPWRHHAHHSPRMVSHHQTGCCCTPGHGIQHSPTREEVISQLTEYLNQLKEEIKVVEERITEFGDTGSK